MTPVAFVKQSRSVIVPPPKTIDIHWDAGYYANFVIVSSTDLTTPLNQWQTWGTTTGTNLIVAADEPQRYFAVYGTNDAGESSWGGK